MKGLPQTAVCNLNITLPAVKKETESDAEDETEKPDRQRHTFASLALRKRYSYLAEPALKTAVERSAATRALPAGYPHKPIFPTRPCPPWSTAPITVPGQTRPVGMGGALISTDSPAASPAASPLKSTWPLSAPSAACPTTIKVPPALALSSPVKSASDIASSSPIRSYRTMPSPIKTVVQQGQYPVQGSTSLVSSGSPCKPATDPASIKSLASAYTSRTSPLHSMPNGYIPERSPAPVPSTASPKTSYSMYSSNLPFKTALGSTVVTDAGAHTLSSVKSISSLSSLKTSVDSTLSSRGGRTSISSLSSGGQTTIASSELSMMNGSVSPVKYPSSSSTPSSPSSRLISERSSSLQERILATTQAATSGVSAAINEAIDSYSVSGYGTLKSLSSSRRSATASSAYGSLRSVAASPNTALSNTMTVPVYSLVNVIPETPAKPGPGSLKMALPDSSRTSSSPSSSLSSCITTTKINSQLKSPPFITPPIIHPTAASNQEILKDVADMKQDLIRMTAILQTDTQTAAKTVQTSHTGTPKETKLEEEEPYTLVEKVKEDLVKVSEILQKDIIGEAKERASEDEWEEFSKDEIEEAQRSAISDYYPPFDEHTLLLKHQSSKELDLAKVVDFLTNDIGASSLSKMAELKCKYEEEAKRDGEEKQKRVLKPSMSIQEHKLKMPPPVSGMLRSPSEKDLSKLAESYQGPDTILESPEDLSHEQDKSPLSDSGFETRSEKTPSAPQSAESTGPKPLFTDSPIPPCVTETRTEVVHIRSYEQPDELCEPGLMEEAATALPAIEPPEAISASSSKALQMKMPEDDSMKSMCLKEETHITTTTRMVYHKPQLTDGAEMLEEAMSVRDIMKAFQSGRDPSKDFAGLFEHKASQDSVKGDELTPRFLDRDVKSKPKVERIIEVHIEKGHSTAEPTEVIIRETKKHPELYVYKGDRGIKELTDYDEAQQEEEELAVEESLPTFLETSRVNTPVSQEEDSRPSSAQLIADDSYKALKFLSQQSIEYCDDELSEIRGESYRFAEKMLLSEKLDAASLSHSDTEDSALFCDKIRHLGTEESSSRSTEGASQQQGSPKREFVSKSSKDGSPKSAKFLHRDDPSQFDKVTVLHYSTEQGSPKHAVWMRFTEDKHDRSRDKLIYEDRVDQTVKEAEEKLSEVSQFFRDKTEKLNDELQSPEKKPIKRELKDPRSWPSSPSSSPEKTQQKPKAEEVFSKSKLREPSVGKMFGSTTAAEKKSSSLPSSPQKTVLSHTSEDKIKQQTKSCVSEPSSPAHVKSTSKVSEVRKKFELEAQKVSQSQSSPAKIPPPVQPKPSIKKLQESKLPVYQFFAGGKVSKASETSEEVSPKKDAEKDKNGSKPGLISACPKVPKLDKPPNKNIPDASVQISETKTDKVSTKGKDRPSSATQPTKESNKSQKAQSPINPDSAKIPEKATDSKKYQQVTKSESASKEIITELFKKDAEETLNKNLRKKTESQIPVRNTSLSLDNDLTKKPTITRPSQIPTLPKTKVQSHETVPAKTDLTFEILDNAPKDSNSNNLPSPREMLEKAITPPAATTTRENFKGIKTLPVYVGVQVGRQAEREAKGALYNVKQKSNLALSPISPDDDTLEQVSFFDSSGKSPITPETPSSEEVSYDLTCRTPDGFMGFLPGKPSPIMEVSEESEGDDQGKVFSFKEALPESKTSIYSTQADIANANKEEIKTDNQHELSVSNLNQHERVTGMHDEITGQEKQQASKDKGIAYIEFPPPPPLDSSSEMSDPERKGSCASSETETEMMEVNLQEEHDKHFLVEPIIRIQPPSPVPPEADDSQSNADEEDDESIFQPIPCKKFTSKVSEEEDKKKEKEKASKSKKHDKNGNGPNGGTNGTNGSSNGSKVSNGKGEDYECEQNGNDQSITDCSIATTAEFSHDTDATEIDSLDGYELQDEDDGLCEQADLRLFGLPDSRRDVWATDTFRSSDRSFPQTKLEVIEEEKTPEECQKDIFVKEIPSNGEKTDGVSKDGAKIQEQKHSDKEGFSDTYFSYKIEEEFNSPFKTVATKGLDFDPWPSKGGEEVVDMGGTRGNNGEPKPFGLAVDDQSQATTPDTTPARTPTDDSTPTSEPNPFPFHEGKMFEMTRSGAIDMSKRDMVEERLQFFQIGPHSPCERTDLRMAIVADHLGLSWTELARELDFSVDEINLIRVENPNSLTAQSFMLLKKWVHRDGKNATTDALTAVLTKINRLDIVTLLEGPIFDYGYDNIDLELQTPSDLNYVPPTPLRSDDFFSEGDPLVESHNKSMLARPSDLSLTQTTSTSSSDPLTVAPGPGSTATELPIAGPEDAETEMFTEEKTGLVCVERPDNDRRLVEQSGKETEEVKAGDHLVLESQGGAVKEKATTDTGLGNGVEEEEEEEMTQERLQSLLEDIKLEEGMEEEEVSEELVNAILEQVRKAEKDIYSVPGRSSETSGAIGESAAPGPSPGSEKGSPDSLADSLEEPQVQTNKQNGGQTEAAREGMEKVPRRKESQEDSSTAGPSRGDKDGGNRSQHKVQESVREKESDSDEETTVTTRVIRRRVVLKGEEARNIPGDSVTEEQFIDEDGNLVTRKVIRKVVRRVFSSEERRQSEGEFIAAEEPAAAGGGGVGGGVASGGADTASSSGAAARATGGKGKKKGKRSRHGHKEEPQRVKAEPGDGANKKPGRKSHS
ncbi:ankyrin-3-like isoform X3 [Neolamprologus brichardi]|uniref:ankyrin-3-like isoform X3 n=1 Tax=Neolamprologus brichardi TaxID=32507 RepID=UPI001643F1C3|nr:ankyrin-3-like isoform X3 [Neolamprologus brichardi]